MHENSYGFKEIMSHSGKSCLNHASGTLRSSHLVLWIFFPACLNARVFVHELNFIASLYLTDLCRGICVTTSEPLKVLGVWFAAGKNPAVSISLLVWISWERAFSSHLPQYFPVINLTKTKCLRAIKIYRGSQKRYGCHSGIVEFP